MGAGLGTLAAVATPAKRTLQPGDGSSPQSLAVTPFANASQTAAACRADLVCRCKIFGDDCRGDITRQPTEMYPPHHAEHYCRVYSLCGADLPEHLRVTEHQQLRKPLTLSDINRMYRDGRPSNDIAKAGLFVHQHDNSEKWDSPLYDVREPNWPHWAGSLVNQNISGLYNAECGAIVVPEAARVLCSYYADFTSWNTGCERIQGDHQMSRRPSRPRDQLFDGPGELKEMLEMSLELQEGGGAAPHERGQWGTRAERHERALRERLGTKSTGEPTRWDFWDGYYNEVLVNRSYYAARLPAAIAGIFYLSGGWEEDEGRRCAEQTLKALRAQYGDKAAHVAVFAHTPGEGFSTPTALPKRDAALLKESSQVVS